MTTPTYIHGEELSMQSYRALIGWVNNQEGIQLLLGRNPMPIDDIAQLQQTITD